MDLLRPLAVIAVTLVALWLALVATLAVIRARTSIFERLSAWYPI